VEKGLQHTIVWSEPFHLWQKNVSFSRLFKYFCN